ncbi:hypothetical protein [Borrelia sp. P9F1]|uniref:hypothetical protein n=1 Tax=Borrelia sp. P9F1 TaxID=3058374 RepID=UPI00264A115E|nr:hypothetical protein [Borrelia sp. P9F1]WKC58712.1 hypothetical protein QYZ68_05775 [Borrelia sp. P9F1]
MKKYRILLILLVMVMSIVMSCGQQTTGKGKVGGRTGRKGKLIAGNKKRPNQKENIEEEIEEGASRDGKKMNGGKKGGREKGKNAVAYEAFRERVKAYRAVLAKDRSKFAASKHAFPDGLNSRNSVLAVINTGKNSFPNLLEIVGIKISESAFQRSEDVDDLYASLDYDVALISKLDGVFSKLQKKIVGSSSLNETEMVVKGYRTNIASILLAMLSNEIGRFNRLVLNEHFSDKNLDKMESKGNLGNIITANALLDTFMEKKAKAMKLIKEQINRASNAKKEEDIYWEISEATKPGNLNVHNAVGLMIIEYNKILKFCSGLGD